MAKKKDKAEIFYVIGLFDSVEEMFPTEAEAKKFLETWDESGEYTIAKVVSKYDVKAVRKNIVKEI